MGLSNIQNLNDSNSNKNNQKTSRTHDLTQTKKNKIILQPLKNRKKDKVKQKQNNFRLDCINRISSRLQEYNYLKDKYLNYCVVKLPKRKRIFVARSKNKNISSSIGESYVKTDDFKEFLRSKKQQITRSVIPQCSCPQIRQCQSPPKNSQQKVLESQKQFQIITNQKNPNESEKQFQKIINQKDTNQLYYQ